MRVASEGGLAVVTGGAGGLGKSFANQLAARGYHLLLVDRRPKELEQACEWIAARHGVTAEPCAVDLCNREQVEKLALRLQAEANVELLVNNAGFGTFDYFVDTDAKHLVGMVDVHVVAPTLFTRAVLPRMIERNRGAIVNVSSLSAWFQSTCNVQYGATKGYLASFSIALGQELRGTNVRVQALCPGLIRTEFHAAESMKGFGLRCSPASHLWMSADEVVKCSLHRLGGKQVIVIPGLGYPILGRIAQMPLLRPIMQWVMRGPRQAPKTATIDPCPAPALMAAKHTESVAAS
jgi:short-subunit dehydrogenase